MNDVTLSGMNHVAIDKVRQFENAARNEPQVDITISHTLHAGMYSRTAFIPKGVVITGALIKVATLLIISGDAIVYTGEGIIELSGYNVIPASENRKSAFLALSDVYLTMLFPTAARTVEEAEGEFTDETDLLQSRSPNYNNGDNICQALLPQP